MLHFLLKFEQGIQDISCTPHPVTETRTQCKLPLLPFKLAKEILAQKLP